MAVCLFCNTSMTPISGSQRGDFRSVSAHRLQKDAQISRGEIYFDFVCRKNCPLMMQIDGGSVFWFSPTD